MSIRLLSEAHAAQKVVALLKECTSFSFAVAWATKGAVTDALLASPKLKRAVVGTNMYITDPDVLAQLRQHADARVIAPDHPRLFHPKVYLFTKGDLVWAVVGSHNLTRGAFGLPVKTGKPANVEASVLIEGRFGDEGSELFAELLGFVDKGWNDGEAIDDDFLFAYQRQYEANKRNREALKAFHRVRRPKRGAKVASPMDLSWPEFVNQTRDSDQHDFELRLVLLERAQRIFGEHRSFDAMGHDERRAIAGTFGTVEQQLDGINWAWFGTMFGQGDFKYLVNRMPAGLSAALDHIPPQGHVTETQYRSFVEEFRAAFEDRAHKGNYPSASRLLAMKRPDQFVAVNSQNREGLCEALNVAPTTLDLDNFWERIVVPVRLSPWWLAPRPTKRLEARLWDNRAAMLDCIYYEKPAS
jgi:hypothetical protein